MKNGLTFQRHLEIANRLKIIRDELNDLWMELSHAYPKNCQCVRQLARMMRLGQIFDQLRSDLDSHLAKEHPEQFDPEIYYGKPRNRKEVTDGQAGITPSA